MDTALKRRMAAGVPFVWGFGVTPSSPLAQVWRWQAGWSYLTGAVYDPAQARETFPGYPGEATRTVLGTAGATTRTVPGYVELDRRTFTGTIDGSL